MDIGLNNRSKLHEIDNRFADVVFLVEANSNEVHNLWQQWSGKSVESMPIKLLHEMLRDYRALFSAFPKELLEKVEDVVNAAHNFVKWEQISEGFLYKIGELAGHPIRVNFRFAIINGKKVAFYTGSSRVYDHTMVENWLTSHFQLTHDNYTRWNHVDAQNFHNCVNGLDNLDKEPRDTIYRIKTNS